MRAGVLRSLVGSALVVWLALTGQALAHAADLASKPAAAFAFLSGRLGDPKGVDVPRLSNAQDAVNLKSIYNLDAAIASRPAGADALDALIQWSNASSRTNQAYIYARGANSNQAIEANIKEFADEISLGTLFNLRLSVTMYQAGLAFMASLPEQEAKSEVRQEGFKRLMLGLYQQVSGLLMMEFSGTSLTAGSDTRAAAALAQDVPIIAASFNHAQREALIGQFEKILKVADPKVAGDLSSALAALKDSAKPK